MGKVKIMRMGFKKTLRKASTIATAKAVTKLSTSSRDHALAKKIFQNYMFLYLHHKSIKI